ncbi:MAG: polysaccharide biosynthesis/export family protein [Pseudanabaenaceae cyanobacterium]
MVFPRRFWGTVAAAIALTGSVPVAGANPLAAYLLGPGDTLDIAVAGFEQYTSSQTILPDGSIFLPDVGAVLAAGQTPAALQAELQQRFAKILVQPVVTLRVGKLRPVSVNVTGEVQRPGPLQLPPVGGNTAPTVAFAIAQAGGVNQNADLRGVILQRIGSDGRPNRVVLNLAEAARSLDGPPDVLLRDGDTLFVPRLATPDPDVQAAIARSSFAPQTIRVAVVGEVRAPGEKQLPPNSSIARAIALSGGATDKANLGAVGYLRLDRQAGRVRQVGVNLSNLNDTTQLQDGDLIVVPKTDIAQVLDTLGNTLSPLFQSLVLLRVVQ